MALAVVAACVAVGGASTTEERLDGALRLVESLKKQAATDNALLREMQGPCGAPRPRMRAFDG